MKHRSPCVAVFFNWYPLKFQKYVVTLHDKLNSHYYEHQRTYASANRSCT